MGEGGLQQQQHSELSGKALGWYAEGPRFSSASVLPCGGLLASKDIISNHVHNYQLCLLTLESSHSPRSKRSGLWVMFYDFVPPN